MENIVSRQEVLTLLEHLVSFPTVHEQEKTAQPALNPICFYRLVNFIPTALLFFEPVYKGDLPIKATINGSLGWSF